MADLADRAVLTTGANSGIGLATALELARRGFRSIGSVRSEEKAETVQKAAADAGVEVETVLLDVADPAQCDEVMAGLRLYGLVNNAGYAQSGAIEDVSDDEARAQMETMVLAPMRLARLAIPAMREAGGGRIVNVSSIAGRVSAPLMGWYTASKHALEAASDALRMEVARDGIKVVLVEPGGFKTGIWAEFEDEIEKRRAEGSSYLSGYERSRSMIGLTMPLMGQPEQVAKVIAAAVAGGHPRSRYLVGVDAQAINLVDRITPTFVSDLVTRVSLGL